MRRAAAVAFLALLVVDCRDERLVPSLPAGYHVDTYAQRPAPAVDVLWVVDDSASMAPRQESLARNFQSFISLFREGHVDYRMGVATTDTFTRPGALVGTPRILRPDTPELEQAFANSVRVGTQGSAYEEGLEAANLVLEQVARENAPVLEARAACVARCSTQPCRDGCALEHAVDFLRPGAWLYLAFVTDEDDRSPHDVRMYWRAFEQAKGLGNDGTVVASAIIGDVPANGCGAEPGTRYAELVTLMGGELGSICDQDFARALRTLATSAVGLRRTFALERVPRVDSLRVRVRYPCGATQDALSACDAVDREACAGQPGEALDAVCTPRAGAVDGWVYQPERRTVFFAGDSVPGLGSRVELEYVEEDAS
ncbi:vWA domain-containing protein [Myxococcus llanfairpwllgwyngyllgogerychwyrndrobwllllantysiliogogogochensis]|uniref:vWA domain-containing protein n=1 Tax=Myxococcus llanfairpwllgwyngyllgogerychwyrndrobwllllantysiliogogogochensis TaxID=2590453 RepID=UPI0015F0F2BB|nr:vWA domain-containing protein [Myxococcus llanfairpwllgwyngyllgogerychwyrndrobwllllantysiliogogogochensis]